MDTDFTTTQARYQKYLQDTPRDIRKTVDRVTDKQKNSFYSLCHNAHRIISTGTGSSMPAAMLLAYDFQQAGRPSWFMPTGAVLGLTSLNKDDLVILNSQGLNRADAALICRYAYSQEAKLVIFTGNTQSELLSLADCAMFFEPGEEKLFCRPSGVSCNVALVAYISNLERSTAVALSEAWQRGAKTGIQDIDPSLRYVILASDGLMAAATNVTLALREGAGLLATLYDIETYAHGNYVADVARAASTGYIVISDASNGQSAASARRISPFIMNGGIKHIDITSPYTSVASSSMYILGAIAQEIYNLNNLTQYNMNRPPGKEENRYYHDLASAKL